MSFCRAVFLLLSASSVLAYPQDFYKVHPDPDFDITAPRSILRCQEWGPEKPPVTYEGCESALNLIKTFPLYRTKQNFNMDPPYGSIPVLPEPWGTAPYVIKTETSDCAINVEPTAPKFEVEFRWLDVREAAKRIVEGCEDQGGVGGTTSVGQVSRARQEAWTVTVLGKIPGSLTENVSVSITDPNWTS